LSWFQSSVAALGKRGYFVDLKTSLDTLARASYCVTIRESRPITTNAPFSTDILGFPGWRLQVTSRCGLLHYRVFAQSRSVSPNERKPTPRWDGFNLRNLITYLQTQQQNRLFGDDRATK
jgi:hypothetical protein